MGSSLSRPRCLLTPSISGVDLAEPVFCTLVVHDGMPVALVMSDAPTNVANSGNGKLANTGIRSSDVADNLDDVLDRLVASDGVDHHVQRAIQDDVTQVAVRAGGHGSVVPVENH